MSEWSSLECEAKNKVDVDEVFRHLCKYALGMNHIKVARYLELEEYDLYGICKLCIITNNIAMQIKDKTLKVFYIELPKEEWAN